MDWKKIEISFNLIRATQITETIRPPTRGSSSTEGSKPPVAPTPAPTTTSKEKLTVFTSSGNVKFIIFENTDIKYLKISF